MPDSDSESMTSDESVSGEDLADLIARRSVMSVFDNQDFWPHGCIDDIITPDSVSRKLKTGNKRLRKMSPEARQEYEKNLDGLVNFVLERGRKIFAILLCCSFKDRELRQAMQHFKDMDFGDSNLPVTDETKSQVFFCSDTKTYAKPWQTFTIKNFYELYQWKFVAPVFHTGLQELDLSGNDILPFTWASFRGSSGTFGDVHEVTVHKAHQKNVVHVRRSEYPCSRHILTCIKIDGRGVNVAIKKLKVLRSLEQEWRGEVQAHKEINECRHTNIIKFMMAITRDQDRYLMFEWADGGNLREFWNKNKKPALTKTLVKDVINQLRGLADGIEVIHQKGYRHGDMKPENILRVKGPQHHASHLDVGTLKICDMGLTKYHIMATEFRDLATST